jgi:hypothetical protein
MAPLKEDKELFLVIQEISPIVSLCLLNKLTIEKNLAELSN